MRVHLRSKFYHAGNFYSPGVVDPWPEGVKLPASATVLEKDESVVLNEPDDEAAPDTLSEMQAKSEPATQKKLAAKKKAVI